jgi:hypothetical protein
MQKRQRFRWGHLLSWRQACIDGLMYKSRLLCPLLLTFTVAACGGGSSPAPAPTPTPTPTPPPTPANRSPAISQLTVGPGSGLAFLTTFSGQATASDPDGDAVTYEWDLGDGTTATGSSVNKTYGTSGGEVTVKLTVSDGKGGTASDTRTVRIDSMTGTWRVTFKEFPAIELKLTQDGGVVTGTFVQLEPGFTPAGTTGRTDPAEPGRIDATGKFELRFKVGIFLDFYLRGTLDPSGRSFTGNAFNSGFDGMPFTGTKQ